MKHLLKVFAILAIPLTFASCMKEDISSSISQTISSEATIDLSKCKIRRMYQPVSEYTVFDALFTYNHAGNPFSVLYKNSGTGLADHFFFYDAQNRLSRYELRWAGYLHEIHYYKSNAQGRIIYDSATYSDANGAYPRTDISTFEYDAQGRIVKEIIVNVRLDNKPLLPTRRPTFTYDSRGNLAVKGWKSSSYDYKINPLRQNAVFQFIHRNYSMNNAAVQAKYNSMGLPLSMNPTNDFFFNSTTASKVIYDCQ